jgi:hypothetical protein
MNEKWLKMTVEERLRVQLEDEKMAHEMDIQFYESVIRRLEDKLNEISSIARR